MTFVCHYLWLVYGLHHRCFLVGCCFFFQAEDGIRDLVRSRGLGDVYKRQVRLIRVFAGAHFPEEYAWLHIPDGAKGGPLDVMVAPRTCLLYTSDAADERSSVDLGGRRIIKKKNKEDLDRGGNDKKKPTMRTRNRSRANERESQ